MRAAVPLAATRLRRWRRKLWALALALVAESEPSRLQDLQVGGMEPVSTGAQVKRQRLEKARACSAGSVAARPLAGSGAAPGGMPA